MNKFKNLILTNFLAVSGNLKHFYFYGLPLNFIFVGVKVSKFDFSHFLANSGNLIFFDFDDLALHFWGVPWGEGVGGKCSRVSIFSPFQAIFNMEICYSSCIIGHREGNNYWGVDIYDQKRARTYITCRVVTNSRTRQNVLSLFAQT